MAQLERAGVEGARLDAEVLMARAAGLSRSGVIARLRDACPVEVAAAFAALVARRERREPVAYIVGEKEFHSLTFAVTRDVLIPRPETELLVELALGVVAPGARVCDVGTGSGCIAIAIANARPSAEVVACDRSPAALAVAAGNLERHRLSDRVTLVESDLLAAVPGHFDVIVSNPPYVADGAVLAPELDWEPPMALRGGSAGMDLIGRLLQQASRRLAGGGAVLIEIGADQGQVALAAAGSAGYSKAAVHRDLAGQPRVLAASSIVEGC